MSQTLATYNIKGGVGKTSAAANLAYLAAAGGARTLLWDLDPQGASTFLFRIRPHVKGGGGKLVRGKSDVAKRIKGTDHDRLDLLPADFSYRHMDLALDAAKKPTRRLKRVLAPSRPTTTTCSSTARRASRWSPRACSRPPTRCSSRSSRRRCPRARTSSSRGVVAAEAAGGPKVLAFFSMLDRRKLLHRDVVEQLPREHPGLLHTAIPTAADVERMGLHRTVLEEFAPRGRAARAYRDLWSEIGERLDDGAG